MADVYSIKQKNMFDLAEYQKALRKNPKLTYLFLELTDCCNLKCLHCGSGCTARNQTYLSFELIKKVLNEVSARYDSSEIMICTTGGEPLLHPQLVDIISYAKSLGFRNGITTNGTLITEKIAKELVEAGLETVAISVDGLKDSHEKLRNVSGCFDKALEGIKNLRKYGLAPQAISVIHKNNISELEEMYEFFRKENFASWRLVNIEPIGRANENNNLLLDSENLKRLFSFIKEKRFDVKNEMDVTFGCSHFVTFEFEHNIRDFYFQCGAGTKVASIMVNGDIASCLDIERREELVQGNVIKDNFVDVWEKKFNIFRTDRTAESKICASCENKDVCMGDSLHTWNFDEKKPNYCVKQLLEA